MNNAQPHSYGRILRTISLLGTASILSVILGVLKMKVAAVLLGPVGVGIIALLQNAVGVATTLGDMGMRQSGAREIARELAKGGTKRVGRGVSTLFWMGSVFAFLSSILFYAFKDAVALDLLERPDLADELGWSTLAVAATVLAAAMTAILNGHGRIREITRITVFSALASCVVSVAAMWFWSSAAIAIFVISAPLLLFLISLWYVVQIGALPRWSWPRKENFVLAAKLLKLGVFVMLSAVILSLSELAVRMMVQRSVGLFQLGLFSSAWAIGVYYLNFLMVATSSEFFPRLSSRFDDEEDRSKAINLQIQALCFVAAPAVIALSAFCPWILRLMYSAEFLQATQLVRLMVVGDVLRLAVYPLGFVLLAASQGRSYFLMKLIEGSVFAALTFTFLPRFGLVGVGYAHIATFLLLFGAYCTMLAGRLRFHLSRRSMISIGSMLIIAVSLVLLPEAGAMLIGGIAIAIWTAVVIRTWLKQRMHGSSRVGI